MTLRALSRLQKRIKDVDAIIASAMEERKQTTEGSIEQFRITNQISFMQEEQDELCRKIIIGCYRTYERFVRGIPPDVTDEDPGSIRARIMNG